MVSVPLRALTEEERAKRLREDRCYSMTWELLNKISFLGETESHTSESVALEKRILALIGDMGNDACSMDLVLQKSVNFPDVKTELKQVSPYRDCVNSTFASKVEKLMRGERWDDWEETKKELMGSSHEQCSGLKGSPSVPTLFVGGYRLRLSKDVKKLPPKTLPKKEEEFTSQYEQTSTTQYE